MTQPAGSPLKPEIYLNLPTGLDTTPMGRSTGTARVKLHVELYGQRLGLVGGHPLRRPPLLVSDVPHTERPVADATLMAGHEPHGHHVIEHTFDHLRRPGRQNHRPYGTPCVHEHACVKCRFLRVDPAQLPRIEEMTANATERRAEAQERAWLGEVAASEDSLNCGTVAPKPNSN